MANAASTIAATRQDITQIIKHIEDAQSIAASRFQNIAALGGGSAAKTGFDFSQSDITEEQFLNALSTLELLFPTLLGAHATNLYALKLE